MTTSAGAEHGAIPSVCNPIWLWDPKSHIWVLIWGWDHATNTYGRGYEVRNRRIGVREKIGYTSETEILK